MVFSHKTFFIIINCLRPLLRHFLPCCCTSRTKHISFSDVKVLEHYCCCYSSKNTWRITFYYYYLPVFPFLHFFFFLFKVKFKQNVKGKVKYWKIILTAYGWVIWVLNTVSFFYRMLPFYMALVWSTSITMPFNGKLELLLCDVSSVGEYFNFSSVWV